MYISPTRIWTFDYQNRADSTKITPFFRNFPDPACGSLRRTGIALILGLGQCSIRTDALEAALPLAGAPRSLPLFQPAGNVIRGRRHRMLELDPHRQVR